MSEITSPNLANLFDDLPDAPQPIYAKLKQAISLKITSGQWQVNQRIPSESEVVKALGVSRMTVNRALRELTAEGFLVRHQGLGTFVAEKKLIRHCLRSITSQKKWPLVAINIALNY